MTSWRIVCDAGGTNVRMARCEAGRLDHVRIVHTSPGLDIAALLSGYAATFSDREALAGAMIAAAGPVMDEHVKLTNADVTIHASSVREALHRPVRVLNDLEAVAWALPHLTGADIRAISACEMPLAGSKLAVNIGTGFGASLLIDTPHGAHVCALEPGHMKLAAAGLPGEITATLSIEEVLSGLALSDSATVAQFWRWSGAREAGTGSVLSRARKRGRATLHLSIQRFVWTGVRRSRLGDGRVGRRLHHGKRRGCVGAWWRRRGLPRCVLRQGTDVGAHGARSRAAYHSRSPGADGAWGGAAVLNPFERAFAAVTTIWLISRSA